MAEDNEALRTWLATWVPQIVGVEAAVDGRSAVVSLPHTNNRFTAPATDNPPGTSLTIRAADNSSPVLKGVWPPGIVFELNSRRVKFEGETEPVTDVMIRGPGTVEFSSGVCRSSTFSSVDGTLSQRPSVHVGSTASLIDIAGEVQQLRVAMGTLVKANRSIGLHPASIAVDEASGANVGAELDHVGLFDLSMRSLPALENTFRLLPWLPLGRFSKGIKRKQALAIATQNRFGVEDRDVQQRKRADFWHAVANTMKNQGASGSEYAAVRELAYQTRRQASLLRRPSRWLLEAARVFGFGTRIGRPLVVWFAAAIGVTMALLLLTDSSPLDSFDIWLLLDVYSSPVAFLRPQGWEDSLTDVVNAAGGPGRLVMTFARSLGTASIVFTAVAISMHTRLPGIGRTE